MLRKALIVSSLASHVSAIISKGPAPTTPAPLNGAPFNTDTVLEPLGTMDPPPWTITYAPGVYTKPEDNVDVCMGGPDVDKETCTFLFLPSDFLVRLDLVVGKDSSLTCVVIQIL